MILIRRSRCPKCRGTQILCSPERGGLLICERCGYEYKPVIDDDMIALLEAWEETPLKILAEYFKRLWHSKE